MSVPYNQTTAPCGTYTARRTDLANRVLNPWDLAA